MTLAPSRLALCMALTLATSAAWAGRPLATDDAGTTPRGSCQLESWLERSGGERALVLAPACGIAEGLELGADYTLPNPRDVVRGAAGLAVKWAPAGWTMATSAGELAWGLKAGIAFEDRVSPKGWMTTETSVLALATLTPADAWTVNVNAGLAHEHDGGHSAAVLNLAAAWAVADQALLFAEWQTNSRSEVFGRSVTSAGGRWWLAPDKFGVDLTASREAGSGASTVWTIGFGWYGIDF
jgi:hypothetical protein